MAISVVMPALEMAQETGKLVSWRKKEGESVSKGEPLLEIETDKAVLEVEAPADGVLAGVKAEEGSVIPVGQTIAWIVKPGESVPAETSQPVSTARVTSEPARPAVSESPEPASHGARMSPKARRLAKEHGIHLGNVRGTGPDGVVTSEDILAYIESHKSAAAPAVEKLSQVGRLMAERTTQSWTTVPHFFVSRDVDAGALNDARKSLTAEIEQKHGVRLSHTDLLVALVARVLTRHPRMNASWADGGIRLNPAIGIAIAAAVDDGVVAPVIHNADKISLGEIAVQRRDLSERARSGKLHPPDITGATFTISNLGMYQVDAFSAIINPPQAAILAVGSIRDRVVAVDGHPAVRPTMTLTLSCDHRVVDGARAAQFLSDLAEALRDPQKLL